MNCEIFFLFGFDEDLHSTSTDVGLPQTKRNGNSLEQNTNL